MKRSHFCIVLLLGVASVLWSSGLVPVLVPVVDALIPAAVPPGFKQGNGNLFQLSTGAVTSGHCAKFDANGNTVDAGGPCNYSGACSISIPTTTISWNPADVKNCITFWEPYWGYTGAAATTTCGQMWDHGRLVQAGTWTTTCDGDPTTYNNTVAAHIGVVRQSAPNTANPSLTWVPNFFNSLFSVFVTNMEWTTATVLLLSDVTNSRTWYGWSNSTTGVISAANTSIYWRFDTSVDSHAQAVICNLGTCTAVDLGSAPSAGWQSVVIQRQSTGLSAPKITITWNGTPTTFCASGCTASDTNAPVNTTKCYLSSEFMVNGTHAGIYWEIDSDALEFVNLGIQ